jgi:hypothetical protein
MTYLTRLDAAQRISMELLSERSRQIEAGYDATHDDEHWSGEIISDPKWGARARLLAPDRAALIQAAAQIVAEIERMDRAANRLSAAEAR